MGATPSKSAEVCLGMVLSSALLTLGCGGVEKRMRHASSTPCPEVVAQHPSVTADPEYAAQPQADRERYEAQVARCAIAVGKPDMALAIANAWPPDLEVARAEITATADASRGDETGARHTLEELAGDPRLEPAFFTDTAELRRFAGADWFVRLALAAWAVRREPAIEDFAPRLVHDAGENLLPLSVASADPTRQPGEWVMWTGVVREARLDREGNRTLLTAEGVDVQQLLLEQERTRSGTARTYQEAFVPNGQRFLVTVPHVNEALTGLHTITAFGRYRGRSGASGPPVVEALIVNARWPAQRTETR